MEQTETLIRDSSALQPQERLQPQVRILPLVSHKVNFYDLSPILSAA